MQLPHRERRFITLSNITSPFICSDPPASIKTFTSHQKRFEKRFEAFRAIPHPPCLTYDDYLNGSDFSSVASNDLLSSATNYFRSAKAEIDRLLSAIVVEEGDSPANGKRQNDDYSYTSIREENLQLAKVCVHNLLFFRSLTTIDCKIHPPDSKTNVSLELKTHRQFCTLSFA